MTLTEYVTWFTASRPATNLVTEFRRETQLLLRAAPQAAVDRVWIIQRLQHECSVLGVPCAYFDLGDGQSWDYLALVRQTRDQMGAAYFNLLTRALNVIGTGVLPSLDDVDHLRRQDLRAAEGRSSVERDEFSFVRARKRDRQRALEERVTRAFFTCLEALCQKGPVVFIFDSYEAASSATERWMYVNLLTWACRGLLPSLVALAAGRGKQPFSLQREKDFFTSTTTWGHAALVEYVCSLEPYATNQKGAEA